MTDKTELDLGVLNTLLGYQLRRAYLRASNLFAKYMANFDLAPGQYGVLRIIVLNPGRSQTEIAKASGLDKSTLTLTLDHLERNGCVRREPGINRRTFSLVPTDKGITLCDGAHALVEAHEARILEDLTPAEAQTLLVLLKKVALCKDPQL